MKSFKKLLSVLVILAMVASFVPASIAASYSYEDQANILNTLGIFKGISTTAFVPDLGGAVTREQGVIQLVRTLGRESDALAMTDVDADKILIVFSDAATIASWSKKYIAWAVNNKIVAGYPNGKFAPQDPLSGKAYAKLILSALGHTVDAAGFEAACFLMRDKGVITWGTRGQFYQVLSFAEAQKFNDKEALIRDDLVALSYAALKLPYAANYVTVAYRNKSAIQVLIDNAKVTKDKAIAAYLLFVEVRIAAEAAVLAYETGALDSNALIATAEGKKAAADLAVAEYLKGNVTGLAAIVNFNVKFNSNNAWILADYNSFLARITARAAAITTAKSAEATAQTAAQTALNNYKNAPIATLADIAAAEALGVIAANAINACQDASFKTAKMAEKTAQDAIVAARKAILSGQVSHATQAVVAFETAPTATWADIDVANALYAAADAAVSLVLDPVQNAALRARINAVALKGSIRVFNTTTFEINFNKVLTQAQKDTATFVLKYEAIVNPNTIVWVGNNVQIKKADGIAFFQGNYTVTVGGIGAIVLPVTVQAQVAASIAITKTFVSNAVGQNITYTVKDQYGAALTIAAAGITVSTNNMTNDTRIVPGTAGGAFINALDFSACLIGDVVKVTAYVTANPSISTSADVVVTELFTQNVSLGAPTLPAGTTRFYQGTLGVSITATMTDNKGNVVKSFADPTTMVVVGNNVNNIVKDNVNGKIIFDLTAGTGAASIIITNPATGAVYVQNMTVVANPAPDTIVVTTPANLIAGAAATSLAFTVYNQFGDAYTAATLPALGTFVTSVTSTSPAVATVAVVGQTIMVTPLVAGTTTITVNLNTGKSASILVTVLPVTALFPASIELSGTPNTLLEVGILRNDLKVLVRDQFGNPLNNIGAYNLAVASSVAGKINPLGTATMSGTGGLTNGIALTGAVVGATTVTVKLMNGAAQIGQTVSVNYTVAAAPVATTMSITTTQVAKDTAQPVTYKVMSQNGQEMAGPPAATAEAVNLTDAGRAVPTTALGAMDFSACNIGDVVRISAYLNTNPAVNTTTNVTVVNPGSVTLGNPSVAAAGLTAGITGVTITATVKSPSGEVMKSFEGLTMIPINITITAQDKATGVITFTLGVQGPASLTVLNNAMGVFVTKTFTVLAAPATPTPAPSPIASAIELGTPVSIGATTPFTLLPYDVLNQFGDVMTGPGDLNTIATFTSSNTAVVTVVAVGNEIRLTPVSHGTAYIYATVNSTSIEYQSVVTVVDIPNTIAFVGTPASVVAATQTNSDIVIDVKDTTNAAINPYGTFTLTATSSNTAIATVAAPSPLMSGTVGTTNAFSVTGVAPGTATITFELKNGATVVSTTSIAYTVSEYLTGGAITSITGPNVVTNASLDNAYVSVTGSEATLTYSLYNHLGDPFTALAAAPVSVTWSVTNESSFDVMIVGVGTLAAGQTYSFNKNSTTGAGANCAITVSGPALGKVSVTAQAAGVAGADIAELFLVNGRVADENNSWFADTTFNGMIVALDKTVGTLSNRWLVLSTSVGYIVVQYRDFDDEDWTVDGNTADTTTFENNLNVWDTLTVIINEDFWNDNDIVGNLINGI